MNVANQTPCPKKGSPKANFDHMKQEHEQNRAGKDEDGETRMRPSLPHSSGLPLVPPDNKIETEAVHGEDYD
jgi:hypothetical protein